MRHLATSLCLGLLLTALGAGSSHAFSWAGSPPPKTWHVRVDGGWVPEYTLRSRRISALRLDSRMAPTGSVSIAASRRVQRWLEVVGRTSWLRYKRERLFTEIYVPSNAPQTGASSEDEGNPYSTYEPVALTGDFLAMGVGARWTPLRDGTAQPYLEVVPAVFRVRWRERVADEAPESFATTVLGFTGRVGYRIRVGSRVNADFGVELLRSPDLGFRELGEYSTGDFNGLNQVAYVMGLNWGR